MTNNPVPILRWSPWVKMYCCCHRKPKFLVLTSDLYSWHQYYRSQDASGNADDEAGQVSRLLLFAVVSSEVDKLLATLCLLTCQEYDLLAKPIWNPVGKGVWATEVAGFLLQKARENRKRSAGWEPNIYLAQRVRGGRVRVKPTASDCAGEGIPAGCPDGLSIMSWLPVL